MEIFVYKFIETVQYTGLTISTVASVLEPQVRIVSHTFIVDALTQR